MRHSRGPGARRGGAHCAAWRKRRGRGDRGRPVALDAGRQPDARAGNHQMLDQRRSTGDRVGHRHLRTRSPHRPAARGIRVSADFLQEVDPDGSDLGGAIGLAASLIPHERPGRLIVLSDGEANGAPVDAAALRGGVARAPDRLPSFQPQRERRHRGRIARRPGHRRRARAVPVHRLGPHRSHGRERGRSVPRRRRDCESEADVSTRRDRSSRFAT